MSEALAVVSGASRGFGRAVSEVLEHSGYTVLALSRSATEAVEGRRRTIRHDVAEDVPVELLDAIGERQVDLLVNNAGRGGAGSGLQVVDPDGVAAAFAVNVLGPLRLTSALLPALLRADSPTVVNVSSRTGSLQGQAAGAFASFDTSYAYRVSKAAQNMLTISMANEFADRIRFWALHPGSLATGMGRPGASASPEDAARQLLHRLAEPDPRSPRFVSLAGPDLDW